MDLGGLEVHKLIQYSKGAPIYTYRKVDKEANFQPTKIHLNDVFYFPLSFP
jgi:hypothetical protein